MRELIAVLEAPRGREEPALLQPQNPPMTQAPKVAHVKKTQILKQMKEKESNLDIMRRSITAFSKSEKAKERAFSVPPKATATFNAMAEEVEKDQEAFLDNPVQRKRDTRGPTTRSTSARVATNSPPRGMILKTQRTNSAGQRLTRLEGPPLR